MGLARVVVFDPERDRRCRGSCSRIDAMAREAFTPGDLQVTTCGEVPPRASGPDPDLVVVRGSVRRPLMQSLKPVRDRWSSVAVLGAVCDESTAAPELLDGLDASVDDFLCCPFTQTDFVARVRRLLRASRHDAARRPPGAHLDGLVGESPAFLAALSRILPVARSDGVVLIAGETGVGKELFARAVHDNSPRRGRPFVAVNCSGLPEQLVENELFGHARGAYTDASTAGKGLLAEAAGGTLFLDEVDTLAPASQAKLLRLLQDGTYRPLGSTKELAADVRVIAATNAELAELVGAGQFRQDLFYRLNVFEIHVPPLRARAGDIPLLAAHFLARFAARYERGRVRLTTTACRKLLAHSWPGNVRQLEGVLHRAVVFSSGPSVEAADLDLPVDERPSGGVTLRAVRGTAVHDADRSYLAALLSEHHGNVSQAARASGADRRTFQRLLRKYGIERSSFEEA